MSVLLARDRLVCERNVEDRRRNGGKPGKGAGLMRWLFRRWLAGFLDGCAVGAISVADDDPGNNACRRCNGHEAHRYQAAQDKREQQDTA